MPKESMTGQERILAALTGQDCDHPCWAPLIDPYFTASLPEQGYPELGVPEACRLVGADILERHCPAVRTVYDDCIHHRLEQSSACDVETFSTPAGMLTTVRGYTKGSAHVTRWPVQTLSDVKTWQFIVEHTRYRPNYAAFDQRQQVIGQDGLATVSGMPTPITSFLEDLSGVENTYFLLADHPAEMEACFESMLVNYLELYRLLAESPSRVIIDYEDTSSTVISPTYFRRYCAPVIDQYADVCHAAGKLFITHMCGKLSIFSKDLQSGHQDGIDSLCPPTTGDWTAWDARAGLGADKIIIGGIEPPRLERMTVSDTRAYVSDILERMPTYRRFILSTGDATAYGTPVANLRAVSDIVRNLPWKEG